MICTLTARRLKPGGYGAFREAWDDPGKISEEDRRRWTRVYNMRDVTAEDVVTSFGFFDGTLEQLREVQQRYGREAEVERIAPHVDEVLLDGAYEVVEEITT